MRSIFETNPHGRYDMGRFAGPAFGRPVKMGCELHNELTEVTVDVQVEEDHIEEFDPNTLACKKCAKKHRRTSGRMGSARMGDDLTDAAKSVFEALGSTFAEIVKDVPPEVAGVYKDRLKVCQAMVATNPNTGSYVAATQCLRDLYRDIENKKGTVPTALPMPMQQPSSFPIVPVALAGVAVVALVYAFTRK